MAPPLMNQMVRMATMSDGMEYRSAPRRVMNRDRPMEYGQYGMMDDSGIGEATFPSYIGKYSRVSLLLLV